MKKRAYLIINCIAAMLGGAPLVAAPKMAASIFKPHVSIPEGPSIRVLLEKNVHSALLEAKGDYAVINKATGELLSSGSTGKRFVIHALQEGLRWGEEYPEVFQLSIIPRSPSTMLYINGMQYRGRMCIYHSKDNRVTIVNEVPIEEYVKSVVNLEVNEPLSKEALAALVIAARTEAFAHSVSNVNGKKPWDITAQEANYFGHAVTHQKNAVEEAVEWTRFMVLESSKEGTSLSKLHLSAEKAQELADKGYDAKKILQSSCPSSKLGVTALPKQSVVR